MIEGDAGQYVALITSEHALRPKYVATVELSVQPFADISATQLTFPQDYDLDVAVGVQLDAVGLWVGRSRFLDIALDGFFTLDAVGLGFDQGTWKQPFDSDTGITVLPDDSYRTLLRAVIAANNWDGTIPGAYTAWNTLFAGTGYAIAIQDYEDMSMAVGLLGRVPDAVTLALFTSGELDLKPAGVRIADHFVPSVYGAPMFGFDMDTPVISGLDVGAWVTVFLTE